MIRLRVLAEVVGITLLLLPARGYSLPAVDEIMIVQLQTGTSSSASEEFVELYNAGANPVDISKYVVEYYSATSTFVTPSRSIPLHGTLYAGKHYLIANTGYLADKAYDSFSAGFSSTGGHIQLVSPDPSDVTKTIVRDLLGWGTALHPETEAAIAPDADSSLLRKKDPSDRFVDTDNNLEDFVTVTPAAPMADNTAPAGTPDTPTDTPDEVDEAVIPPVSQLLPLQITELLPNPAPPASDSTDEYVEIYNPNAEAVDLSGYKLQTGNSYSYSYTFTSGTIGANSYEAFLVTETGTLLANTSGKVRLIDPNGQIISETESYEDAADGLAWALLSAGWLWSTTPTPSAANVLSLAVVKAAATTSTTKPKVVKAVTKPKKAVKAATTKKAATSVKKPSGSDSTNSGQDISAATEPASLHTGVLAGVSILAVGYAAYEYRHDMANRIYQFRRYREARRAARKAVAGR